MRLMHEYALEHVLAGLTTLDEVQRVVPIEGAVPEKCQSCEQDLVGSYQFCPHCGRKTAGNAIHEVEQEKPEEQGVVT
jgi:predicted amidophosphoribosyltransferase